MGDGPIVLALDVHPRRGTPLGLILPHVMVIELDDGKILTGSPYI